MIQKCKQLQNLHLNMSYTLFYGGINWKVIDQVWGKKNLNQNVSNMVKYQWNMENKSKHWIAAKAWSDTINSMQSSAIICVNTIQPYSSASLMTAPFFFFTSHSVLECNQWKLFAFIEQNKFFNFNFFSGNWENRNFPKMWI